MYIIVEVGKKIVFKKFFFDSLFYPVFFFYVMTVFKQLIKGVKKERFVKLNPKANSLYIKVHYIS